MPASDTTSTPSKDPPWKRDELILALDLYMRKRKTPDKNDPDVLELSNILRKLPIHKKEVRSSKFRSPNSIAMKCGNFQYLDPETEGGLPAISKLDREIWNEFADNREGLHALANHLKEVTLADASELDEIAEDSPAEESMEVKEGETLYRLHKYKERNAKIVTRKKEIALNKYGKLECEVCGFDYEKTYGPIGSGFMECHHKKPLSQLSIGEKTRTDDLALICASCHRMIHRKGVISIEELRSLMNR